MVFPSCRPVVVATAFLEALASGFFNASPSFRRCDAIEILCLLRSQALLPQKRVVCTRIGLFLGYSSSLGGVHVSRMLRVAFVSLRCMSIAACMLGFFSCLRTCMPALSVLFLSFVCLGRSAFTLFVSPLVLSTLFLSFLSFPFSLSFSLSLSLCLSIGNGNINLCRETHGLRPSGLVFFF